MDKEVLWNKDKNAKLKKERRVSFENVLEAIATGALLDVVEHPNNQQYPNQELFVVMINDYAYLVPFIETEKIIFIKTIIPSRKAVKQYLSR